MEGGTRVPGTVSSWYMQTVSYNRIVWVLHDSHAPRAHEAAALQAVTQARFGNGQVALKLKA